jgi:hypothetical protein
MVEEREEVVALLAQVFQQAPIAGVDDRRPGQQPIHPLPPRAWLPEPLLRR